jgi:hypothetical protein
MTKPQGPLPLQEEKRITEEEYIRVILGFLSALPLMGVSAFAMLGAAALEMKSPETILLSFGMALCFVSATALLYADAFKKDSVMLEFFGGIGARYTEWNKSRS